MNPQEIIQQSIESLKAQGFTEELIAVFLRQMEQSTKAFIDPGTLKSNFYHVHLDHPKAVPFFLNPDSTLTRSEQWAIACGADIAIANGYYLNDLTTGQGKPACREMLATHFDIDSTEEAIDSINWLLQEGHRHQFDILWQAISMLSIKEAKEYFRNEVVTDERDEAILMHRFRNLRDTREAFIRHGLLDPAFKPDMLIWDYGRIINLCRTCYDAEFLSQEIAMPYIMHSAEVIAKIYSSWRGLSLSYQFARFIWKGYDEETFKQISESMELLLSNAGSPWVTLHWDEEIV